MMSKRRKIEYKLGPENLISVEEAERRGHVASEANPMIEHRTNNGGAPGVRSDEIVVIGRPERWKLLSHVTAGGRDKSTLAMEVPGGALVNVSTMQRNTVGAHAAAEALVYVPGVRVEEDANGGHKLVKSNI